MIKFLFGKMINELVAKEVAKEDDKVKQHCVTLVKSLFDENAPTERYIRYGWVNGYYEKTAKGEMEQGIANIVIESMKANEGKRIDEKLAGEEFIDSIVERIRNKQIK